MTTAPNAPLDDPFIGRKVGGLYVLTRAIASGSMGRVYEARHSRLGTPVAVKVLHASYQSEQRMVDRFEREARAASAIRHPNIVHVFDFVRESDGTLGIVMELIEGATLAQVMSEGYPFQVGEALVLIGEILEGVQAAHDHGVVHRDLKPANVLLADTVGDRPLVERQLKLVDFGVAKVEAGVGPRASTVEMLAGTPEYMSPEQCRGHRPDRRSDLYSVMCILYRMLTRAPVFESETAVGLIMKHVSEAPVPPSHRNPDVPRALDAVVLRGLAKDPEERFQSAVELRNALQSAVGAAPVVASRRTDEITVDFDTAPDSHVGVEVLVEEDGPEIDDDGTVRVDTWRPAPLDPHDVVTRSRASRRAGLAALLVAVVGAGTAFAAFNGVFDIHDARAALASNAPEPSLAELAPEIPAGEAPARDVPDGPAATPEDLPDALAEAPNGDSNGAAAEGVTEAGAAVDGAESEPPRRSTRRQSGSRSTRSDSVAAAVASSSTPPSAASAAPAPAASTVAPSAGTASTGTSDASRADTNPSPSAALASAPASASRGSTTASPAAGTTAPSARVPAPPPVSTAPPTVSRRPNFDAAVRIVGLSVRGALAETEVRRGIERASGAFRQCYVTRSRAADRDGYGEVRVELTLSDLGRARGVSARGGSLPGLASCVQDSARSIASSRRPDAGEVQTSFRVAFGPP